MGNSLENWKRVPTTTAVLFDIELPYRPPKNRAGAFLWRRRMLIETSCGLSLLEPWEKVLILTLVYLLFILVFTGLCKLMPHHVSLLYRRTLYYLFGSDE